MLVFFAQGLQPPQRVDANTVAIYDNFGNPLFAGLQHDARHLEIETAQMGSPQLHELLRRLGWPSLPLRDVSAKFGPLPGAKEPGRVWGID